MVLTPDQRIARLREKGIRQIDIAKKLGYKWISHVNNVLHERNMSGEKTEEIRSVVIDMLQLPYSVVWGPKCD